MNGMVVVVGASDKPDRYSYRAFSLLKAGGYDVRPVHPTLTSLDGIPAVRHCDEIQGKVHTVTLYINPKLVQSAADRIVGLKPERVIFNPGTETETAERAFEKAGIRCLHACTIVLLTTGQFDSA